MGSEIVRKVLSKKKNQDTKRAYTKKKMPSRWISANNNAHNKKNLASTLMQIKNKKVRAKKKKAIDL